MAASTPLPTNNSFVPPNTTTNVPSFFLNGVTGYNNVTSGLLGSLPQVPQYFFTVPFANNQAVLYKLSLNPISNPNVSGPTEEFIFPLTPSNVTKQVMDLTAYYDVRGDQTNFGVRRIIDQFGLTPPIITISGTTGYQFHSQDGYQWSGRSSFARLVQLIQAYATQVAAVSNSTQPASMPILEFTDGYTGETYQVVPLGQQTYSMDVSRPIIQTYNLQFLAQATTTPQAVALSQQDPIAAAFIITKALLTSSMLEIWNNLLSNLPGGSIV